MSDSPYLFETNSSSVGKEDETFNIFAGAFAYSAFQRPIEGVSQLVNRTIGAEVLTPRQVFEPPMEMPVGSPNWYFQQIGSGMGTGFDYLALRRLMKTTPFAAAGRSTASALERNGLSALTSRPARLFAAGFAFEGIANPIHVDESDDFWRARFRNATNGGVALGSLALGSAALEKLGERSTRLAKLDRIGMSIPSGLVAASFAGVATAETQSLLSNQRLATLDEIGTSAGSYMLGSVARLGPTRYKLFVMPTLEKTGLNVQTQFDRMKNGMESAGQWQTAEPLVEQFRQRAQADRLSEQEVARTYYNISRLYKDKDGAPVDKTWRQELGLQSLHRAIFPTSVDQGKNPTCMLATIESSAYSFAPSDAIRLVASAALDGRFKTFKGVDISLLHSKIALSPDKEARETKFADMGNGKRPYVSQIFQLASGNAYWQSQTEDTQGNKVPRGDIKYLSTTDESGENFDRVEKSDGTNLTTKSRGPHLNELRAIALERLISGNLREDRVVVTDHTSPDDRYIKLAKNPEELHAVLTKLKEQRKLPVMIGVNHNVGSLWEAENGPSPIVLTDEHLGEIGHAMQITDYSPTDRKVSASNSWGNANDYTGLPGQRPKLSVDELFELMREHPKIVHSISVSGNPKVTDDALKPAKDFQELIHCDISDTAVSDKGFANISGQNKLQLVDARNTRITDDSAPVIATLQSLKAVVLAKTAIDIQTAQVLGALPKLELADISNTQIKDNGIAEIGKSSNLRMLDLSNCKITDGALPHLANLKKLEHLSLDTAGLSEQAVSDLIQKLPALQRVILNKDFLAKPGLDAWLSKQPANCQITFGNDDGSTTRLVSADKNNLKLEITSGTAMNLATIDTVKVRELGIQGTSLTHDGAVRIGRQSELARLVLANTKVTPEDWKEIFAAPQLKQLSVISTELKPEFFKEIGRAKGLQELNFSMVNAFPAEVSQLAQLQDLQVFTLSNAVEGTPLTWETLSKLPNLAAVALNNVHFAKGLGEHLSNAPKLQMLSLLACNDLDSMLTSAKTNKTVEQMELTGTPVSREAAKKLAKFEALKYLALAGTQLNDEGLKAISAIPNLQVIDARATLLTDASVDALLRMSNLTGIDLSGTHLTEGGIRRLVAGAPKLTRLIAQGGTVTPELAKQLALINPNCTVIHQ